MCDFNALNDEMKKLHHDNLLACADNFGGKGLFLGLLESIRETKPHPLTSKNAVYEIEAGTITWSKAIFNDTLQLLLKARQNESEQDNLLPKKGLKNHKKILNVLRTLKPIIFQVKPANPEDGSGFSLSAFDVTDENKTKLNPLFDAVFFCSVDAVKRMLNYEPKAY